MRSFIIEVLLLVVLGVLTFSAFNPYWMPMGIQLTVISVLIVLFAAFAVFVVREVGGDEREIAILHRSDRLAFLTGATVLLAAVVYNSFVLHFVEPWTCTALAIMVLTKIVAYIYYQRR